jgi:hypothetical protein
VAEEFWKDDSRLRCADRAFTDGQRGESAFR